MIDSYRVPRGKTGVLGVSIWCGSRPKARDVRLIGALVCPYQNRAPSQNHQSRDRSRPFSLFALVLLTIISIVPTAAPFDFARADDCLAAPNSTAPKGSHWYYHLNRATQQKCWYVRSSEKRPQGVTARTMSTTAAMPSTNGAQAGSTGPREIDSSARQPEPVVTPTQESAYGTVPAMQVAAAVPEVPSSDADPRPTAPTTSIWPDPPPIPPSVKADDAGAAAASHDPVYSVADASDSVSRKEERTSTFDIPIGLFPAFAFGLVVLCFGLRFLMKRAADRRAQEVGHTEAVTTTTHDYAKPSGNGLADEPTNFAEDDYKTFVSAVSGRGPLERVVRSVHSANDICAREARLAQLREDIGQRLGWAEPEQQYSSRQKLAS
jgi:hypothetical protein